VYVELLLIVLLFPLSGCAPTVGEQTPPPPAAERILSVRDVGELFLPAGFPEHPAKPDLLIHFHGHPPVVWRNVRRAHVHAAVLVINYPGLSSSYRVPFEKAGRFREVLASTLEALRREGGVSGNAQWGHIYLSSFSAGFGAVREILKHAGYVKRVDGYLALDSIYAGLVEHEPARMVDPQNMAPFRRFAQLAAQGGKRFILTHTQLPTPDYASTVETAADLVDHVDAHEKSCEGEFDGFRVLACYGKGRFEVYSCAGDDGQAHMQHLREMWVWLSRLRIP